MEHVTFFVDPAWQRQGLQHIPLLYTMWGNPLTASVPFWRELFERRCFDTKYYSVTTEAAKADMVLMPYSHNVALAQWPELLDACAQASKQLSKPLFIDGLGDIEHPVKIPNTVVLRYGGYRFMPEKNAIHIPPYADDLLELYSKGELAVRNKGPRPLIGFVGWASLPFGQKLRTIVKELPPRLKALGDDRYAAVRKGVFFRAAATAVLKKSPRVATNFILRSTFSANLATMSGKPEDLRREFVENLLSSDYGLCVRGDANASVRLFETLALGRIPVIVDTECILPFADEVDYRQFSLIVDFRDMARLPDLVADFHNSLTNEQFMNMQRKARAAYVNYFRVDALMPHILKELDKILH